MTKRVPDDFIDHCGKIPPHLLHQVVSLAGGAAYLVAPAMVAANTRRLRQALAAQYANCAIAYPFKSNYNKILIRQARAQGALSEVVSIDEFHFAQGLGVPDREIIFNGPGKSSDVLQHALSRNLILIADSIEELRRISSLRHGGCEVRATLGIRVTTDLSFQSGPSHFGIDLQDEAARRDLHRLVGDNQLRIGGIHLHYSGSRSLDSFRERLAFLLAAWGTLDFPAPQFIDVGGGFASAMPLAVREQLLYDVATLESYGETLGCAMKQAFRGGATTLILEPGMGLLADAGVLVTPVLDVKRIRNRSIAIVDGTSFCVNPLRSALRPALLRIPCKTAISAPIVPPPVEVYGNSCMEIDLLAAACDTPLAVGDLLVFAEKGAYAACMASPFTHGIPALVSIQGDNNLSLERSRTNATLLDNLN